MDAKALAKSKRAHSLHHSKKHHPNPASRAPVGSVTPASGKKATRKQEKDKSHQSSVSKELPSNWDRYTEEFDLGSEESPQVSTSHASASDVVAPKSKGADYAYLISEAKAQCQSNSSSDSYSLFDDVLNGFNHGLGPLLSVEGQRMLSWISDDDFPYDDKGTNSHEASFFSLNLHSLAEQLSKASLVERLFIGPDILPPELLSELQANNEKHPDEGQATCSTEATEIALDGQASSSSLKNNRRTFLSPDCISSNSSTSSNISAPTSINPPADDLCSGSTSEELPLNVHADSVAKKPSRFEATAAEAELDMLLDSFNETKFFDSTTVTDKSNYTSSRTQVSSIQSVSGQHEREGPHGTNFGSMNATLDDTLDDLLKETSNQTNLTISKELLPVHEVKVVSNDSPSASQPNSKSKILDDFDSWLDTI